jgi:uncharacterized membrane protein
VSATTRVAGAAAGGRTIDLDLVVARILNIGTVIAVTIMAVGVVLMAAQGISPLAQPFPPLNVTAIPSQIAALEPAGFLWLGLIAMIATPILRVVLSLAGYIRTGERRMAWISLGTLGVIALSVVIALLVR